MTGSTAAPLAAVADGPIGVQRLRAARDVRAVFAARRTSASDVAVVHVRRRGDTAAPRFTVVAGKNVGNAVARNRVKRRLRAVVQTLPLSPGCDYVVVGRARSLTAPAPALRAALSSQVAAVSDVR